jgi:HAMP domain-containing protein
MAARVNEKKDRGWFVSLRVQLLVAFTVLFTLVFAGAFYWFYTFATNSALTRIHDDLEDTVTGAVAGIDPEEFRGLVNEGKARPDGQSDDPRYQKILAWMDTVHRIEPRAYPYTYIKGEDTPEKRENLFIVDYLQIADPARAAGFRESWKVGGGESRLGLERLTFKLEPYTDKWGSWVSAYTPIVDARGEVVGALGLDFRADYVYQVQRQILDSIAAAFAITYLVLFVLVFFLSRALTRPIGALTRVAHAIGEGDYSQDLSFLRRGLVRDEIAQLSAVIETMVSKVQTREQSLIMQVQELKIEVDESRRKQQVGEIVDTEFFRDLSSRAREMRNRSQRPSPAETSSAEAPSS